MAPPTPLRTTIWRWRCGVSALLVLPVVVSALTVRAAPPATQPTAGETPSAKQLRDSLVQLKQTLAKERAALAKRRKQWKQQEQALAQRREKLASQVLEAELQRGRSQSTLDRLKRDLTTVRRKTSRLTARAKKLLTTAHDVAEPLNIHLGQVPASERLREQTAAALDRLPADAEAAAETVETLPRSAEPVITLLDVLDTVHQRATRPHVRREEIWTAKGRQERVALLDLGHVAFAYRTLADGRTGVALASPEHASGFRWRENLAAPHKAQITATIDQLTKTRPGDDTSGDTNDGNGSLVTMPMDVTGRLTVEGVGGDGWVASLRAGGLVMLPLIGVAGLGAVLTLERLWSLYIRHGRNHRLVASVLRSAHAQAYGEAEQLARRGRGAVARTLTACLAQRERGTHAMEDAIQAQLLHETPRLQRFLGAVAILAAVAPLLGLLGTVTGIIQTFGIIRAFGQTDPGLMAGGISEALVTTATGLVIAIPLLLLQALLRGRVDRLIAEAEKHAATLLNVLTHENVPARNEDKDKDKETEKTKGEDDDGAV